MLHFREKQFFRRVIASKITLVVLLTLALLLSNSVWGVWGKMRETAELRAREEARLAELEARAAALQAEIDRLTTERGIEAEIRSKFDLAKSGESVLVITDPKETEDGEKNDPGGGFFSAFLNLFR